MYLNCITSMVLALILRSLFMLLRCFLEFNRLPEHEPKLCRMKPRIFVVGFETVTLLYVSCHFYINSIICCEL